MSHYQLTESQVDEYVVLNSVKMVSKVADYDWSRFAEVVLALDFDQAGVTGKVKLAKFFLENYPNIKISLDHPPLGMDWNDYLLQQKRKG